MHGYKASSVAQTVKCWTGEQEIAGSITAQCVLFYLKYVFIVYMCARIIFKEYWSHI